MFDLLIKQLVEKEGITQQLKTTDQMAWVGAMNNIRNRAEEIVNTEVVYTQVERRSRQWLRLFLYVERVPQSGAPFSQHDGSINLLVPPIANPRHAVHFPVGLQQKRVVLQQGERIGNGIPACLGHFTDPLIVTTARI